MILIWKKIVHVPNERTYFASVCRNIYSVPDVAKGYQSLHNISKIFANRSENVRFLNLLPRAHIQMFQIAIPNSPLLECSPPTAEAQVCFPAETCQTRNL
jgi:hypothetical protein